eukprot:CAMPEP_0194250616 /NCGR_PEP_ID=MMETSP0158-20130606/23552_1 /TAXON_ID=33649 /ORGANISM="Thalassionema nitzschioides, Strain L26-B" /LENGTH=366 /DNA_ID=CAMNT_0038987499 /DNA_START=20 /DNA_END=1117 /DNA_ORIENTATION=-
MTTSKTSSTPSFGDPYEILGLDQSASESVINKAFRKLSLQLHPDKQQGKTESEKKRTSTQFHNLKEAKTFLLTPSLRQPYDLERTSRLRRKKQDHARDEQMTAHRRKMKQDLAEKEAFLMKKTVDENKLHKRNRKGEKSKIDLINKLRSEGKRRREEHAEKTAEGHLKRAMKLQKKEKEEIQSRQVRLKWSRKRISISPSEHSIADMLSRRFGEVSNVVMIGSKGNSAIVTFRAVSSCQPCVDFYATSDEMRATLVVDREEDSTLNDCVDSSTNNFSSYDNENLADQRKRQAAEREHIIREMMETERQSKSESFILPSQKESENVYPLNFPNSDNFVSLSTPLEKLQQFEKTFLNGMISEKVLMKM